MDTEKTLPLSNLEDETQEILQLSLMLMFRNSVNRVVTIPRAHLEAMKQFTVDVKVDDVKVQYKLLPQRGSSNPPTEKEVQQ